MITPRFQVEQTESDLIFTIRAPYASIANAEIRAELNTFYFSAPPYFLRLHLSGHIEETDASKSSYDAETGTFVISLQKVKKEEHFENLDFITFLLTPPRRKQDVAKSYVEVVGVDSEHMDNEVNDSCNSDDYDDNWYIDQCPYTEPPKESLFTAPHYGFANKISGAFQNFQTEFLEVIDLPHPDSTLVSDRAKLRTERELEDFSDDHYLADWAEPDLIGPLLEFKPQWENDSKVNLLDKEVEILKDLPKKEFLLEKHEEYLVCFSLVDLLYAFAYNFRTTMGENTVESAWTVNKLSATLSWLQNFSTLKEAICVPVRRSLCYPLYRHWGLAIQVLEDVKNILKLGQCGILKCLLEIYTLFNSSEPRYLLNQLYIRDYCIWIQQASESRITSLSAALDKIMLSKSDVELDLEELETAAESVRIEHEAAKEISQNMKQEPTKVKTEEEKLCKDIATLSLSEKCSVDKITLPDTPGSEEGSTETSDTDEDSTSSSSSVLDSDDLSD